MNHERAQELWSKRRFAADMSEDMTPEEDQFIRSIWQTMPSSSCWMDAFFRVLNPWVIVNTRTGEVVVQFESRALAEDVMCTIDAGRASSLGSLLVVDGESYAIKYRRPDGTIADCETSP